MKLIKALFIVLISATILVWGINAFQNPRQTASNTIQASEWSAALVTAARDQIGVTLIYDGSYQALNFPMGDVDRRRGVCSDVIIRAFRDAHNLDLQELINHDMKSAFKSYPTNWGLTRTDRNIDHRRVPNLRKYLARHNAEIAISKIPIDYRPGDLVTWMIRPNAPHIGIVSDQMNLSSGNPLILHNIGLGTRLTDMLFKYEITGHYRPEAASF